MPNLIFQPHENYGQTPLPSVTSFVPTSTVPSTTTTTTPSTIPVPSTPSPLSSGTVLSISLLFRTFPILNRYYTVFTFIRECKNKAKLNTEHSHHVEAYSPQSVFDGRTSVASDDSRGTVMNYHQSAHSVRSANGDVINANVNNLNNHSVSQQCHQQGHQQGQQQYQQPKHQLPHPLQRPQQATSQSQINTQVQKKNPLCRQPSGSTGINGGGTI